MFLREKIIKKVVDFFDFDARPVVEPSSFEVSAGCAKPKGAYQYQAGSGCSASADDIPGVLWDLWLKQNNFHSNSI